MKIDDAVLEVLSRGTTASEVFFLPPGQLERKLYESVDKVLKAAGGKWNRKSKGHVFDGDASEATEEIILTGEYRRTKQDFGVFYTPANIARQAVELITFTHTGVRLLEPSAGIGRLAIAARDAAQADDESCSWADITCLDILPKHVVALRGEGFHAECADFLDEDPGDWEPFDIVLMNPPFPKRADIHHVNHAIRFVKKGGRLVAIMSAGVQFRQDRLAIDFRQMVADACGTITRLPEDSFRESGTSVNTVIVAMDVR